MDPRFAPHNSHREQPASFSARDPHLRLLGRQPLVYRAPLLGRLPRERPGIYTITGGRQVGKTTCLKQWMAELLAAGVPPASIAYVTGELIDDHHALVRVLRELIASMAAGQMAHLIIDEATYIREWDRGVKFLADAGELASVVLIVTGSDQVVLREARARLPGRRGRANQVDFHMAPLTFLEALRLTRALPEAALVRMLMDPATPGPQELERLFQAFDGYLLHGGYLTAINEHAVPDGISAATLAIYSDWVRGDVLKRHKQEHYLREILQAVLRRLGSQVTWNAMASDLSIQHPATVADYLAVLESMDVLFILPALLLDKLGPAQKKARKVGFNDPFILHALRYWLAGGTDPLPQIRATLQDPMLLGALVEQVVASHVRRYYPTYYIKAKGEVDVAYLVGRRVYPIEVKWTGQVRPADIKQIATMPRARIFDRSRQPRQVHGVQSEPLPLALARLCAAAEATAGA